jgi:hypothetical protein
MLGNHHQLPTWFACETKVSNWPLERIPRLSHDDRARCERAEHRDHVTNVTSNATGGHVLARIVGAKMAGRMGPTLPGPLFMGRRIRGQYKHTLFL